MITIGLALSTRSWRSSLQRHCRDHVADVSVTLVRDVLDVVGSGASQVRVVIVDDDTSWLSLPALARVREAGAVTIGVFDPEEADGHGANHLRRLGIDTIVPSTSSSADLVELVRSVAPEPDRLDRFRNVTADDDSRVAVSDRRVVAVGGPAGAGATETAVALAASFGNAVLVDIDETHPSIARRLGLAIHPHVVTAVEAVRGERLDPERADDPLGACLARRAIGGPGPGFDVIAGLAARDDWTLLRSDDAVVLVDALAARWPTVVTRLGPNLEDLSRHVPRYEVSRCVAGRATAVVGVCDATAVGVLRFLDWLVDLVELVDDAPIHVLLNRAPRSPGVVEPLREQLRSVAGPRLASISTAPLDRRVERAAWDAAVTSRGPFTKAVDRLAARLDTATTPAPVVSASDRSEVAA